MKTIDVVRKTHTERMEGNLCQLCFCLRINIQNGKVTQKCKETEKKKTQLKGLGNLTEN